MLSAFRGDLPGSEPRESAFFVDLSRLDEGNSPWSPTSVDPLDFPTVEV